VGGTGEPLSLRADCTRCFGLCCAGPAFSASADFAIDKPAGQPCPHLGAGFRCTIHSRLRAEGFPGCAVFDCFGAGQRVSQLTFGGRDWRAAPATAPAMFAAFAVMRQLHELLWYLGEALAMPAARPLHASLRAAAQRTGHLARGGPAELASLDVAAHRDRVNALLLRASDLVRAGPGHRPDLRGADLTGAALAGARLHRASLRGARLLGASLRDADLTLADVTGADFRGADLRGCDLSGALFLTQAQLDAARGDGRTKIPPARARPAHWPTGGSPP
jgi:uncharacterized protein YjbI with pentapeptide repeats